MEWLALLIPICMCVLGYIFFNKSLVLWEYLLPFAASILVILICKVSVKTALVTDDEYWGSTVIEARYYEYWSTWVDQTCSSTSCDSKGENCTTTYYDCSYCSSHSAYWMAYDDAGNSYEITKQYYNELLRKWHATPTFKELNRDIDTHGSCGEDGDMYYIRWDNDIMSADAAVTQHTYTNRVQASHSAFKLPYINSKEAKQLGLYDYPIEYSFYKQKVFLGADSIYTSRQVEYIEQFYQYFNGHYGALNKVKLFVCLYFDKPLSIADKQEAYWDGGNQNELVICLSINRQTKQIQWVKPFSWTDNKRILVDLREDIMQLKTLYPQTMYDVIEHAVNKNIVYKNFNKDFSYLTVDLPTWALVLIWVLTLLSSAGVMYWGVNNDITNEPPQKPTGYYNRPYRYKY